MFVTGRYKRLIDINFIYLFDICFLRRYLYYSLYQHISADLSNLLFSLTKILSISCPCIGLFDPATAVGLLGGCERPSLLWVGRLRGWGAPTHLRLWLHQTGIRFMIIISAKNSSSLQVFFTPVPFFYSRDVWKNKPRKKHFTPVLISDFWEIGLNPM